ncbi:MAG: FecR domain-containing protein [Pseudolabrys sp.]
MNTIARVLCSFAIAVICAGTAMAPAAAKDIGVASAVVNHVTGLYGGRSRALAAGNSIFSNEHIRTGDASSAQILLRDKTSLSIGPRADLTLDRFVYNPDRSTGRVVLSATQGAFRFITGAQNPTHYTIKTPVANLGLRGTILDVLISRNPTTGETTTIVILISGSVTGTVGNKQYVLNIPGTAYVFSSDGSTGGSRLMFFDASSSR